MKGLKQWGEMRISKWHFRLVSLINTAFLFLSLLHYYLALVLSAASSPTLHLGQMTETRRKKSGNWLVILMPAIIWQIFDMKDIKSPETKMRPICWELPGNKSWNHNEWTYFLADFNLLEPLCPPVFVPGHSIVSHLNTSYFCKLQNRLLAYYTTEQSSCIYCCRQLKTSLGIGCT